MRIIVKSDNYTLLDTSLDSYKIVNPKTSQEVNKVGSFTFTVYPDHPHFDFMQKMKSIITIYEEGISEPLFRGRIYDEKAGFYNEKQVFCEGELAFFNDSLQRPWEFTGTPEALFRQFIATHNSQVDDDRQFTVGKVTVTDPNDYIIRSDSECKNTWKCIEDKLIKTLGGYLWTRHEDGINYIDYLEDFTVISSQPIQFGKNLLDLSKQTKADGFYTAIVPYGAKLKDEEGNETGKRLTIDDVNDGVDYVYNAGAVAAHGYIYTTNTWDDVTESSNLKRKAQEYIDNLAQFTASINVTAADLAGATINGKPANVNSFRIGRYVNVETKPHGLDSNFIVSKLTRELLKPEATKLVLGVTYKSLTEKQKELVSSAQKGKKGDKGAAGKDAAIQSATEPEDKTYMWLDISAEPPLLKRYNTDTSTWEAVNDMSSISDSIVQLQENVYADISKTSEEILSTVSESYSTIGDVERLVNETKTEFEQTAENFEMRFTSYDADLADIISGTDVEFKEIRKYIRFVDGKILLGEVGNQLELQISNDRISFLQDNAEVAYFSDRKLYVTDGEYTNSLQLGAFAFIPRANGNLSFKHMS